MSQTPQRQLVPVSQSQSCCNETWEQAYLRFETPEEERHKFHKRFQKLGVTAWPRNASVLEIFCGRGNGLVALEELGFTNLEGADLSQPLLEQYTGPAKCYVCDCRKLPFPQDSHDRVICQGGVHHLPNLPDDLDQTFAEVARILKPDGLFALVEPWRTPFLTFVHAVSEFPPTRRLWGKLDALAVMTQHEHTTYYNWLGQPDMITRLLDKHFHTVQKKISWGKLMYVGRKR